MSGRSASTLRHVDRFVETCDEVFADCVARVDDDEITTDDEDVVVMGVGFKMRAFVALTMLARSAAFRRQVLDGRDFALDVDDLGVVQAECLDWLMQHVTRAWENDRQVAVEVFLRRLRDIPRDDEAQS